MKPELAQILEFTHTLGGLKNLLRFKGMPFWEDAHWERWDSVAEHSHRMALLAIMLYPHLSTPITLEKTLKIILIHDVVELLTSDYSPMGKHGNAGGHAFDNQAFTTKYEREMAAAKQLFSALPPDQGIEFVNLFEEYINTKAFPGKATSEGKFAYALDKIEAVIQIIDYRKLNSDWSQEHFDKSMQYMFEWTSYDPGLLAFCELIRKEGSKITKTNLQ